MQEILTSEADPTEIIQTVLYCLDIKSGILQFCEKNMVFNVSLVLVI